MIKPVASHKDDVPRERDRTILKTAIAAHTAIPAVKNRLNDWASSFMQCLVGVASNRILEQPFFSQLPDVSVA